MPNYPKKKHTYLDSFTYLWLSILLAFMTGGFITWLAVAV